MIVIGLVSQVRWMKASPPTYHIIQLILLEIVLFLLLCYLVVPQILARLLCGALGVPHQAALLIVHLIKNCYFSPRILLGFPNAVLSNQIYPRERWIWSKSVESSPAGRPPGSWAHIHLLSCTCTPPPVQHSVCN